MSDTTNRLKAHTAGHKRECVRETEALESSRRAARGARRAHTGAPRRRTTPHCTRVFSERKAAIQESKAFSNYKLLNQTYSFNNMKQRDNVQNGDDSADRPDVRT